MLITILKNRNLFTDEDMENDENKDYYLLIKVQPIKKEVSASDNDDIKEVQKVGIIDSNAVIIPNLLAEKTLNERVNFYKNEVPRN